jgi:hypothetical protein
MPKRKQKKEERSEGERPPQLGWAPKRLIAGTSSQVQAYRSNYPCEEVPAGAQLKCGVHYWVGSKKVSPETGLADL